MRGATVAAAVAAAMAAVAAPAPAAGGWAADGFAALRAWGGHALARALGQVSCEEDVQMLFWGAKAPKNAFEAVQRLARHLVRDLSLSDDAFNLAVNQIRGNELVFPNDTIFIDDQDSSNADLVLEKIRQVMDDSDWVYGADVLLDEEEEEEEVDLGEPTKVNSTDATDLDRTTDFLVSDFLQRSRFWNGNGTKTTVLFFFTADPNVPEFRDFAIDFTANYPETKLFCITWKPNADLVGVCDALYDARNSNWQRQNADKIAADICDPASDFREPSD